MKRPILLHPFAFVVYVPLLLLLLCWFALRGNNGSSMPQTPAPQTEEPEVITPQASLAKETPPSPEADQPLMTSTQLEGEARAHTGTGQSLPSDFLDQAVQGNTIRITLPDATAIAAEVQHIERDEDGVLVVAARFDNPHPGTLLIQRQTAPGVAGPFVGHVLFDGRDRAWKIEPTADRTAARFVSRSIDDIVCRGIALPPEGLDESEDPQFAPQDHPSDIPIPHYQPIIPLQSLPGATGVIYLDFDGEEGPFPGWGDNNSVGYFDAAPANATNAQIYDVWKRVSEDFQGFNLNITTDRKVFEAASVGRRQQIVITPTNDAAPGAGGVAYVGSYNWTTARVCWAFIQRGKSAAEVISHEIGHTLRLRHHGRTSPSEEYYGGHGSGDVGWAPIMGVGYSKNLSQWSKGEYLNANRSTQDDLQIIVTDNNDVAYRNDDSGDSLATAAYLEIFPDDSVDSEGIIERTGEIDAFRFKTFGGSLNLNIGPVTLGPNLDIHAEIVEADTLAVVVEGNPVDGIDSTLSATLAAGEYLLRVRGTGRGDPLGDGYTDYGSLGAYLISGAVSNSELPERFSIAENSATGTTIGTITPRNDHGAAALAFTITSGNTGGAFALDPASGTLTVADTSVLDYETLSTRWDDPAVITPFVSITNPDNPSLNETLRVVVDILDVNEAPSIVAASLTMPERTASGTLLTTATGSDLDRFQLVTFSIESGNADGAFAIDPDTGAFTVAQSVDVAQTLTRQLTLAATDTDGSPLTTTTNIDVTIVDHDATDASGQIKRTVYENISGSTIDSLTSHPSFPTDPAREILLDAFDGGQLGDNYGSTMRGYLIVPATGDYLFRIAADNSGSLLFASDGDPTSATEIASTSLSTSRYQWDKYTSQLSSAISLVEGQVCYIEARQKESTSSDHVAVAWTGPLNSDPEVIPGRFLVPVYQNYVPKIPETTLSIRENAIPGQTVGMVSAVDANIGDTFNSFEILGGTGQAYFAIDAATGRVTVAAPLDITTSPLTLDLRVSDDGTPPLTGEGSINIEITPADTIATTGIIQQIWTGISGASITNLTSQSTYPNSPSTSRTLTNGFDSGTNYGESYGSRIRAFVIPPTTGEYTFYITTDDNGQLLMSNDTNPAGAGIIARVDNWAGPGDWTKFASQTSAPRQLTAGERYYIETLHKEGGGGDHVQVAWTGPGIASPTIIPASALEPFDINAPPEFNATSYAFTLDASQPVGTLIGTVTATDPEGESVAYAITEGNAAGHFAIDADGRITFASAELLFNGVAELTVTAQDAGIDGAYPLSSAQASVTIDVSNAQDLEFPVPDPMFWSSPPAADSTTAITMTAAPAFGQGGVEYFFECLTPGGQSSGWQASSTYTDTGLVSGGSYTYRVKVRDLSPDLNETGWSPTVTATLPVRPDISGGEVTEAGGYVIHTFREGSDSQLTVQGEGGSIEVDVLIVAGGGGGGSATNFGLAGAAGAGAGGVVYREGLVVTASTPVTVGGGGAGAGTGNTSGSNGENSSFGNLVALGGGGGAGGNVAGKAGGSGGGGRGNPGGAALQPDSASGGFGNAGATWPSGGGDGAGGGGGAGAPATAASNTKVGGTGGDGLAFDISGTLTYYAGGGGGGGANDSAFGPGGLGGGGSGGNNGSTPTAGAAHTGGGGGGGNNNIVGASGGSGIVIVRYPLAEPDDYANWADQWPGVDIGGPEVDFNGDGMTNDEKRIWGLDPTDASSLRPIVQLPDPETLSFTYTRRLPALTGGSFNIWTSSDLVTWERDDGAVQISSAYDANYVETVTVTLSSGSSRERLFVRVVAE